jgi:sporulation protein YlmC with PRC-barrel domain
MDIPIDAEVSCTDGPVGQSTRIVLNPLNAEVTHLVLKPKGLFEGEYLVPVDLIADSGPDFISLRCTKNELAQQKLYSNVRFVDIDEYGSELQEPLEVPKADTIVWPYVTADGHLGTYADVTPVPHDELAVHRGTRVESSDGHHIGRVDEFLVDPDSYHVSHLILREGHLLGHRDVAIPVDQIERAEEDVLRVKLDKKAIGKLPRIPIKHRKGK